MAHDERSGASGAAAVRARPASWRPAAWLIPAGLLLAGCGAGKGDVTGEVTYDGEPLSFGRITFVGESGNKEAVTAYIVRGKYTLKRCPAGPVKVAVESMPPPPPESFKTAKQKEEAPPIPMAKGMKMPELPPEVRELTSGVPLKHMRIPVKYANPETSGLTYTVKRGSQEYNVPLSKQ